MADAPCYFVGNFHVHDAARYREYEKGFFPLLKKHGGSFLTFDDNSECVEGDEGRTGRVVMFQFPNEALHERGGRILSIRHSPSIAELERR